MRPPHFYDPRARDEGVEFGLEVDGRVVPCRVGREALEDHFGAGLQADSWVKAYVDNRDKIDAKALAAYRLAAASGNERFTRDNPLVLRTEFF